MYIRNLLRCAIAFTVAMPLYALADSFNAKPGAWEIATTTLTNGMMIPTEALAGMPPVQRAKLEKSMQARSGKPSTHVTKSCVTKADLDQDRVLKPRKSRESHESHAKVTRKSRGQVLH